jgi:hypothetical protein
MAFVARGESQKTAAKLRGGPPTKTTVVLPAVIRTQISWLMARLDLSQTQAIREAIEIRFRLQKEIDAGATVVLERSNGERVRLWFTGSDPTE